MPFEVLEHVRFTAHCEECGGENSNFRKLYAFVSHRNVPFFSDIICLNIEQAFNYVIQMDPASLTALSPFTASLGDGWSDTDLPLSIAFGIRSILVDGELLFIGNHDLKRMKERERHYRVIPSTSIIKLNE